MTYKDDIFRTAVARKIREIRGDMSQVEFARLIGIEQSQISQYECGRSVPGMEVMIKIHQATGVDLNTFADSLGGIDDKGGGN